MDRHDDGPGGPTARSWTEADRTAAYDRVLAAGDLPGVQREEHDGHVGLAVRGRRFAWLMADHQGDGRLALAVKTPPGEQEALLARGPEGFFPPPYLASRGWVGVDLAPESHPDWEEIAFLVEQAWRMTASRTAVARWERSRTDGRAP